ncbi:MAG TPA: hypothetical protein VN661_07615 [Candidatus Acidoferrales bacterium]|nr:hypothetical protein [Candidatus Acidoferrales bacterium]
MRFRLRLAVYSYPPSQAHVADLRRKVRGEWLVADRENVNLLFSRQPRLRDDFHRFLDCGCTGVFLTSNGVWVSYGWFSKPGSRLPHHLPAACRAQADYWIFFCRTREEFRSQGCYRCLLAKIAGFIRSGNPGARVHVDTQITNTASLRAIRAAGFAPCGTIVAYKMGIPFLKGRLVRGYWHREAGHPSASPELELAAGAAAQCDSLEAHRTVAST